MFKKLTAMTDRFSDEALSKIFLTLLVISSFLLGALWSQFRYALDAHALFKNLTI